MSTPFFLIIAAIIMSLIFIGLYLTYKEFQQGSPKLQEDGLEELANSPHGHA